MLFCEAGSAIFNTEPARWRALDGGHEGPRSDIVAIGTIYAAGSFFLTQMHANEENKRE